jgi:hypothetical protein
VLAPARSFVARSVVSSERRWKAATSQRKSPFSLRQLRLQVVEHLEAAVEAEEARDREGAVHRERAEALRGQDLGQGRGRVAEAEPALGVEHAQAVLAIVEPRQDGGVRDGRDRGRAEREVEARALGRERVEVRSLAARAAVAGEGVGARRVERD